MVFQTFGDLVNFNPHVHVLAADRAFLPEGRFVALPPVPGTLLAEGFRRAALDFLVKNEALSEELRSRMLTVRHGGFSAHNEVRVVAEDAEGRKKLAGYMLRAPRSLEKMTYESATGTVIYRSKMHAGLKRNFQVKKGDVARFRSISASRLTGERIRNPRLLGGRERRRPVNGRDDSLSSQGFCYSTRVNTPPREIV